MSFVTTDVIEVRAWGRRVGALALDPTTEFYAFEYDGEWLVNGEDLSPLHLPRRRGVFVFPELSRRTYYGLPALIADALPDRFGNALVDAWMADQGVVASEITALDRLAYASDRTMGALTFAPPLPGVPIAPSVVNLADLVTAAREELHGTLRGDDALGTLRQLISVGSTAGGARAKAVIAYNPVTDQIRSGQFGTPGGFEQWLVKLDGVGAIAGEANDSLTASTPFTRIEYAYYLMALDAGVEMSPSRLLLEGPRAHFLTRRFDRRANDERVHVQTLCAMAHLDFNLPRTHSYASYFMAGAQLGLTREDYAQMFRRVVFNVMGVNRDDHTKNFSFLLPEGGTWALAPAYDVTHALWSGEWTQGHQMSVNAKFSEITLDDLRALGEAHDVPDVARVLREVRDAIEAWPSYADAAGLDDETTARIADDHARLRPR
ncbi:MAG: type II toxin-antitoxin system HipA family toxin [Acidobacteriota bacterium]|nr:type II toxin-antitoxin system HipA family toxin [Acidobacteriota bacterium]